MSIVRRPLTSFRSLFTSSSKLQIHVGKEARSRSLTKARRWYCNQVDINSPCPSDGQVLCRELEIMSEGSAGFIIWHFIGLLWTRLAEAELLWRPTPSSVSFTCSIQVTRSHELTLIRPFFTKVRRAQSSKFFLAK